MAILDLMPGLRRRAAVAVRAALWAVAAAILSVACTGGGSGGSAAAPLPATSIAVPPGGGAPPGMVNSSSAGSLFVDVVLGTDSLAEDLVIVRLTDVVGLVALAEHAGIPGGGVAHVGPIDVSGLADGALTVSVEIIRGGMTTGEVEAPGLVLDQTPPAPPQTALLPGAGGQPDGVISAVNVHLVSLLLGRETGFLGDESFGIVFGDGVSSVSVGPFGPPAPGATTIATPPIDLSGLQDGPVSVQVVTTDPAGNAVTTNFEPLVKDAFVPVATAAYVPAGPQNPAQVVNQLSATTALLRVEMPATTDEGNLVEIRLLDGISELPVGSAPAPVGGGTMDFPGLDLSALEDGSITPRVVVTDASGNQVTFTGAPFLLDTQIAAPLGAFVAAGPGNAAGAVNANNVGSVFVALDLPASLRPGDQLSVSITDALGAQVSTTAAAPSGLPFVFNVGPLDLSGLVDGNLVLAVTVADAAGNAAGPLVGGALKDAAPPASPLAASVAATGLNPAGWINAQSQGAVTVVVDLPGPYDAGSILRLVATDGIVTLNAQQPAPVAGTSAAFSGLAFNSFLEGPVSLELRVEDAAGNVSAPALGTAVKDVTIAGVSAVALLAGPTNPAGWVNEDNQSAASLRLVLSANAIATDAVQFTVSDGLQSVTSGAAAPPGGGALTVAGLDLSALADGMLTVQGTVSDAAGNVAAFGPAGGIAKDVVDPALPVQLSVAAGPNNGPNEVNLSNLAATLLDVTWPAAAATGEQVTLTLSSSGGGTIVFGPVSPLVGGGAAILGPVNLGALGGGTLSISVAAVDAAGNAALGAGTPAQIDLSAVVPPTAAGIVATPVNASNVVNLASVASVDVLVAFPTSYVGSETVSVTLMDSVGGIVLSPATFAPVGGGFIVFSGLDLTGLADGTLLLVVDVDPGSGPISFPANSALKDTVAPVAPSAFGITAGPMNAADEVTVGNVAAVAFTAQLDASLLGNELATLKVTDANGLAVQVTGLPVPAGGGATPFGPFDLGALQDGSLTLSLTLTDPVGNRTVFAGTPALKTTNGPAAPLSAVVAAGPANAAGVINASTESSVSVQVVLGPTSTPGDGITVHLSDGVTTASSATQPAPGGAATVTVVGIDASALADGPLQLVVHLDDGAGGLTAFTGSPATKDTSLPPAILGGAVAATANNPAFFVNLASQSSVLVQVQLDPAVQPGDAVAVVLVDSLGATATTAPKPAPAGGGTLSFTGLSALGLAEGPLALQISVTDGSGNVAASLGTPATLDRTPPAAPLAAQVASGAQNPANFVNAASAATVGFAATLPASYDGTEDLWFSINDGVNPLVLTPEVLAPAGGGAAAFPSVSLAGLAEGTLSVVLNARDEAGNAASFNGAAALKDTIAPPAPTALGVAVGVANGANLINEFNVASVALGVVWPAGLVGDETADYGLVAAGGGSTTLSAGVPGGGGAQTVGTSTPRSSPTARCRSRSPCGIPPATRPSTSAPRRPRMPPSRRRPSPPRSRPDSRIRPASPTSPPRGPSSSRSSSRPGPTPPMRSRSVSPTARSPRSRAGCRSRRRPRPARSPSPASTSPDSLRVPSRSRSRCAIPPATSPVSPEPPASSISRPRARRSRRGSRAAPATRRTSSTPPASPRPRCPPRFPPISRVTRRSASRSATGARSSRPGRSSFPPAAASSPVRRWRSDRSPRVRSRWRSSWSIRRATRPSSPGPRRPRTRRRRHRRSASASRPARPTRRTSSTPRASPPSGSTWTGASRSRATRPLSSP
ncbi:MAG: hypothetical protein R3F20_11180 [Planctomycetota bacterium]